MDEQHDDAEKNKDAAAEDGKPWKGGAGGECIDHFGKNVNQPQQDEESGEKECALFLRGVGISRVFVEFVITGCPGFARPFAGQRKLLIGCALFAQRLAAGTADTDRVFRRVLKAFHCLILIVVLGGSGDKAISFKYTLLFSHVSILQAKLDVAEPEAALQAIHVFILSLHFFCMIKSAMLKIRNTLPVKKQVSVKE